MCPESEVRCAVQIHWFSIINSCVTVLLLTGFLATILMRVLKNDFIKYTRDDDGAPHPLMSLVLEVQSHAPTFGNSAQEHACRVSAALQLSFTAPCMALSDSAPLHG